MFDVFFGIVLAFGFFYLITNFSNFATSVRALIGFVVGVTFMIYMMKSFT